MDWDRFEEEVGAFLRDELRVEERPGPQASLYRSGLLDSASLVQLAGFLEEWAGVSIPDRDVKIENFDTLHAMKQYLRSRLPSA